MNAPNQLDWKELRQRLASSNGKQYWRSLEELSGTPEFQMFLEHEFPQHSEQWQQSSLGATDAVTQASLLTLYDPDRSQTVVHLGNIASWDAFQAWFNVHKNGLNERKGQGLHILAEAIGSPTLADQMAKLLAQWPQAKW